MDKTRKKYIVLVIVTIVISVIALIGASYALLTMTIQGDKKITLTAGILKVDFEDGNYINLDNAAPMTDAQGQKLTPYTFTITNTGNINAYYHVSLEEEATNTLTNNYLKMRLTNDAGYDSGVVQVSSYGTGTFDIKSEETLEPSDTVTYTLWMWLDNDADNSAQGKEYKSKIVVTSYDRAQPVPTAVDTILAKANPEDLDFNSATSEQQKEMWTFSHPATEQTTALTDYRYIGANPNNYVTFNNETWRIIGVFSVDDGTGNVEQRLKLIRNESIGDIAWDSNNINDWPNATLNTNLNNGDYWTNSLTSDAKSMIGDTVWYLGGSGSNNDVTASMFYERERGTTVYSGRSTSWTGKVGLMYPSDYGYATSGGTTTDRNTCLNKKLYSWDSVSDCYNNDWIFNSAHQWTITPHASTSDRVFSLRSTGYVHSNITSITNGVRPVVFLKSSIKIVDGDGSSSNPYILQS
ncbi:MAG TPA: hypothetical protein IAB38_02960 [Candidatus Onthousia excrementipullorum]|uniref:Uncharacterized protein n=1 Tax=Candidatus Onthousia excrementipullorum TaxID=2840884 RepID=A0A9D1J330_9FIRM|nr:hypothetical protein [Candidatus Onthousia excrementipullorum]